jgi:lipopolysaccharide biosynthesis regulator YciM
MAHALARLAADYASVGDLSNAEALYQHAVDKRRH